MPTSRFQPSFAAGVLAPGLHGRIDIAKYDVGLKVGYNIFCHAHGGFSNRAGTEFVAEVMDSTELHRLIPFRRDDNENYVMLMGDLEMKIIEDGGFVQSGMADYNPTTPYTAAQTQTLDYVQSIDVMFMADKGVFPQKMSRTAVDSWTFANLAIDPALTAPTAVTVTPKNAGTETYTYVVTPVDADGVEGFASLEGTSALCALLDNAGEENVITWTGTSTEFNVYKERNGIFGYIGFTEDNTFTDDNISPDLTVTPPEASGIFASASEYPSVVTLHQQRLILAGSTDQPETYWASRTGNFENFTKSRITQAADRIEGDIIGEQINQIRAMMQLRELLIFTSSGEFSVTGPQGSLVATNPIQTQYGYSGTTGVKVLVVEDTALFVDRTGRSIRDLRYAFEQDGYAGKDLTVFAEHFFRDKSIAGWAFAKNPYSLVWVYLDDGTLLSLTYKREHRVWAWCEHNVGGTVESLAVIPENGNDTLYLIVKRFIDGADVRYVERMKNRNTTDASTGFFVDSGITYSGVATDTITGLDHLEGETVVALADGNVVENLTVTTGSVTLPFTAELVHVGLSYYAEGENLPPAVDLKDVGSARGRKQKVNGLYLQLENTRGIKVGPDNGNLTEYVQTGSDLALDIPLFTGMTEKINVSPSWNRDGTVVIRQDYPLPMTVLGIAPDLSIGRTG